MMQKGSGLIARILAVVCGFALADVSLVVILAPGLIEPANWTGLISLLVSAFVMYLGVGVYMIGFWLLLKIINKALRLDFSQGILSLLTVIFSVIFLLVQQELQIAILPVSVTPNKLYFYVPTLIAIVLLCAALLFVRYLIKKGFTIPAGISRAFAWPGLVVTAFISFMLYASTFNMLNVLAVYSPEEQRNVHRERIPDTDVVAGVDAPNFIVVAIEAFRRDEFTEENTPFLWQLAQDNIWLSNYNVVASATRPSVTSFFTSLYPAQHGAYNLAINQIIPGHDHDVPVSRKISKNIIAFPRLLQDHGYNTVMVTSNQLTSDRVFGFEKVINRFNSAKPYEFSIFEPEPLLGYFILSKKLKYWKVLKMILFTPDHSTSYFDATRLNQAVMQEIEDDDDRPFMWYIHYIEPHTPYYHHPYRAIQFNPVTRDAMYAAYRDELTSIDKSIAALYQSLAEKGRLENTWMLITADHGEEFYDHQNWGHGKSVYPEVIGVPAILIPPGNRTSSKAMQQIPAIIESIDIAPTFAEIAGISAPKHWEGKSIVPLLTKTTSDIPDTAFSQFDDGRYFWSSAIDSNWQIIYREPSHASSMAPEQRLTERTTMLFNLDHDPMAQHDLYNEELSRADEMNLLLSQTLTRLEASAALFQGEEEVVDSEQLEQLRALGYVE